MSLRLIQWIALVCLAACAGCAAAVPYRYGRFHTDPSADQSTEAPPDGAAQAEQNGPQVEFGKPNKTLDGLASLFTLPEKILGLNPKIDNHAVSLDTVTKLRHYLDANDLADVSISVNCYDPLGQWRALRENRRVGAGWRYSFGTLSVVGYTLFPNRIFGGDAYNPYTNSLYVDSDVPAIAMMEAAYAKRIHAQKLPGTYVAAAIVPGVGLARQCRAVGDVLGYARAEHDWEIERQGYQVLYAQVGAEAGTYAMLVTPVWWAAPVMGAGGAAAGHAAGRLIAARRIKEVEPPGSQQLAHEGQATSGPATDDEDDNDPPDESVAMEIAGPTEQANTDPLADLGP